MNAQVLREERAHHHAHAVVHISVNASRRPLACGRESFPVSSAGFVQGNGTILSNR